MTEFPVATPQQLPVLLQAFRKSAGLTQAELATRLGITQQSLSAIERNAAHVGAARLLHMLTLLNVQMVLRPAPADALSKGSSRAAPAGPSDTW
jgi:HTH-type transcriptional regulator / antitoxin HipB